MSARQAARRALLRVVPRRMLAHRGPDDCRKIFLTFDDGPHPEVTPRLLDGLKQHEMTATFFVVGQEVERHPEIVRRIVEEGHTLGTHSWSHSPAEETSAQRLVDETVRTTDLIEDLTEIRTRLCRPPYGAVSAKKLWALWRHGQAVVLWSCDPKDFECQDSAALQQRLLESPPLEGDIVLMHDNRLPALECLGFLAEQTSAIGCSTGSIREIVSASYEKDLPV